MFKGSEQMFRYQEDADEFLQRIIPSLSGFSHLSGGEGTVYFIDENFVVKKYFKDVTRSTLDQRNLILHCCEVNKLNMRGLAVPRIYSIELPTNDRPNTYLLEERVKGSCLFSIDGIEPLVEKISRKKVARLQRELISAFKTNYLTVNEQLEALPESEIERFILTDYFMTRDFKYGVPDVIGSNVLFDGNTLTHIDSYFAKSDSSYTDENGEAKVSDTPAESTLKDMLDLMYHNGYAQGVLMKLCGEYPGVKNMVKQNRRLVRENMKHFISKSNNLISPKFSGNYLQLMYEFMTSKISETLNGEEIDDITKMIEKE